MNSLHQKYYEQSCFWNYDYLTDPVEKCRIDEISKLIPQDVNSILDVGCGNGSFLNFIQQTNRFERLVGIDSSREALKYVKTQNFQTSAANLPFEDNTFDMLTCLEVLEHLTLADFEKCLLELQRVSKKYIIISVPNKESLQYSQVLCPKCYCRFNPKFHLRTFDTVFMPDLIPGFDNIQLTEIGPDQSLYNVQLLSMYRFFKGFPLLSSTSVCPQCGYQGTENNTSGQRQKPVLKRLIKSTAKLLADLICTKRKRWLVAVYRKKTGCPI